MTSWPGGSPRERLADRLADAQADAQPTVSC